MKKNPGITSAVALSGGITGAILFLAASHLNDRLISSDINYFLLFSSILLFCILFPVAWLLSASYYIKVFKTNPEITMKETGIIFMTPVPAAAALAPLFLFYGKIAAIKLKVVGYIYLPFTNYLHVNPAGYYIFTLLGLIIVTIAALLLYKFAACLYNTEQKFDGRQKAVMILKSFFIFYAVVTSYITVVYPPTGDEPHYLTISQSMSNDFDVNLENNYLKGQYREFYPVPIDYENPIHNTVDKNGRGMYSLHFPGLPAVISVFHHVAGRFGSQLLMNFFTAALAALFYMFLCKNFINEKVSIAAVFIIFTTVPFSIASSLVMTEVPAALIILYAIMKISHYKKEDNFLLLFAGIAFLPWLHAKMVIFSVVFYVWYYTSVIMKKSFDIKKETANNLPVFFSFVLMTVFFYSVFGKFAPFAVPAILKTPGSYFAFSLKHVLHSAAAVIFDRDYGIFIYAPVYIAGLFGLVYSLVKDGLKRVAPAAACLPYLVMFLFWNDWGGSMYPSRQILPVLAVAGYYAAYFMQERNFIKKKFFKFLAVTSLAVSYVLMIVPAFRYFSGREKIYVILEKVKVNILWFFPSFSDIISFRHMIIVLYTAILMYLFIKYAELKKH
jgi:hypothetical protein